MSDPQTERIYCAQQINIPSTFPHILKLYAKAAIRTQPYDLLRWTAAYFRALANGEVPPVKARLEYPPFTHPTGITPGYLKTLLNRYGRDWHGLDLPETSLYQLFIVAGLLPDKEYCDFYRFLAVACGFLGNNLLETMIYVCELLTHEPEGGSAMIPLRIFSDLYRYLANLDCSGERPCCQIERDSSSEEPCVSGSSSDSGSSSETSDSSETTTSCSCEFATEKVSRGVGLYSSRDVYDAHEMMDDAFDLDEAEQKIVGEAEAIGETASGELASSSKGSDSANPRLGKAEVSVICCQMPPPMQAEVEAGRLETIFRVSGIGPPVSSERVTAVGIWLADCARRQEGLVGPRNIRHFLCPKLDDISECVCT
ncbi:hypothetical protein ACFW04_005821 [Cataglyphis niger]